MNYLRLKNKKLKLSVKLFISLFIVTIVFIFLNNYFTPIITSFAQNKAVNIINKNINLAITDELSNAGISYQDIIHINRSDDNNVLSLQTDTILVNTLKSAISLNLQDRIANSDDLHFSIPLGSLLGFPMFIGFGPDINFNLDFLSSSVNSISGDFVSVGINQSNYSLYFEVTSKIAVMLPLYNNYTEVTSKISVADAVIVGDVPDVYVNSDNPGLSSINLDDNTFENKY